MFETAKNLLSRPIFVLERLDARRLLSADGAEVLDAVDAPVLDATEEIVYLADPVAAPADGEETLEYTTLEMAEDGSTDWMIYATGVVDFGGEEGIPVDESANPEIICYMTPPDGADSGEVVDSETTDGEVTVQILTFGGEEGVLDDVVTFGGGIADSGVVGADAPLAPPPAQSSSLLKAADTHDDLASVLSSSDGNILA